MAAEINTFDEKNITGSGESNFGFLLGNLRRELFELISSILHYLNETSILRLTESIVSAILWEVRAVPMVWQVRSTMPNLLDQKLERLWISRGWYMCGNGSFSYFVPGYLLCSFAIPKKNTFVTNLIEDQCPDCGLRGRYCTLGPGFDVPFGCGREPPICFDHKQPIPIPYSLRFKKL